MLNLKIKDEVPYSEFRKKNRQLTLHNTHGNKSGNGPDTQQGMKDKRRTYRCIE